MVLVLVKRRKPCQWTMGSIISGRSWSYYIILDVLPCHVFWVKVTTKNLQFEGGVKEKRKEHQKQTSSLRAQSLLHQIPNFMEWHLLFSSYVMSQNISLIPCCVFYCILHNVWIHETSSEYIGNSPCQLLRIAGFRHQQSPGINKKTLNNSITCSKNFPTNYSTHIWPMQTQSHITTIKTDSQKKHTPPLPLFQNPVEPSTKFDGSTPQREEIHTPRRTRSHHNSTHPPWEGSTSKVGEGNGFFPQLDVRVLVTSNQKPLLPLIHDWSKGNNIWFFMDSLNVFFGSCWFTKAWSGY